MLHDMLLGIEFYGMVTTNICFGYCNIKLNNLIYDNKKME